MRARMIHSGLWSRLRCAIFLAIISLSFTGCLFKTSTVQTRHFLLAPIPASAPASAPTEHSSLEIVIVKMPAYLLRDSVVVRTSPNEIKYLDEIQWGERLDHGFQRTIAANLSQLLASDVRTQINPKIFITVEQSDVDTNGAGTLIAQWRVTFGDRTPTKSGQARLTRSGAPPRGNPEVIATTLSTLTAEFSKELAKAIDASVQAPRK